MENEETASDPALTNATTTMGSSARPLTSFCAQALREPDPVYARAARRAGFIDTGIRCAASSWPRTIPRTGWSGLQPFTEQWSVRGAYLVENVALPWTSNRGSLVSVTPGEKERTTTTRRTPAPGPGMKPHLLNEETVERLLSRRWRTGRTYPETFVPQVDWRRPATGNESLHLDHVADRILTGPFAGDGRCGDAFAAYIEGVAAGRDDVLVFAPQVPNGARIPTRATRYIGSSAFRSRRTHRCVSARLTPVRTALSASSGSHPRVNPFVLGPGGAFSPAATGPARGLLPHERGGLHPLYGFGFMENRPAPGRGHGTIGLA